MLRHIDPDVRNFLLAFAAIAVVVAFGTVLIFRVGLHDIDTASEKYNQTNEIDERIDHLMQGTARVQAADHFFALLKTASQFEEWSGEFAKTRAALATLAAELPESEVGAQLRSADARLQAYETGIRRYAALVSENGATENDGTQGKFRSNAHRLETLLQGRDRLLVGLLQLRRAEKDFMLRLRTEYLTKFEHAQGRLSADLSTLPAALRDEAQKSLSDYAASFRKFAVATSSLSGLEEAASDELRGALQLMAAAKASIQGELERAQGELAAGRETISRNTLLGILLILAAGAGLCGYVIYGLSETVRETRLANRTKSEFLAMMSHELRTPLNAIIGFSDLIREEILGPLGNPLYKQYVTDIRDSGRHLLELIDDVLEISRMDRKVGKAKLEAVNLIDAVNRVARNLSSGPKGRIVPLAIDIGPELYVLADKSMLKRMLHCLVDNAIKFTPKGNVSIGAHLTKANQVTISVRDTGIGINKSLLKKIRQPFFQADHGHTRRFEGSGLGLTLVQMMLALNHGTLSIESEPGVGTTVSITLPAASEMERGLEAAA